MRLNVPLVDGEEAVEVGEVLATGFLTQGPRAAEFERLVAERVGCQFAFATSSATTGLHLALVGAGVEPGDEVIVPDFSFPATANAVIQQGATPVFVDIDLATFNLDPALLESAVTSRTRAVMPVHAFGLCADMDRINEVASRHEIPVIEDAACALTGSYHGRQAGSLADAGVFSFHPRKVITTGEGGMITTNNAAIAERMRVLRTHGGVRGELYLDFVDAGFNYRMSDVNAAIGIAQMRKLEYIAEARHRLGNGLTERLRELEGVTVPSAPSGTRHSYQSYVVLLAEEIDRNQVIREMKKRDVETTLGTYSMHLQPYFRQRFGIPNAQLPNSTRAHHSALTLPLYPQLTPSDLDVVVEALSESIASSTSQP